MKRTVSSESGQALIETALALPVLLIVLFGIIEFGVALARYQVVTNASREGARAASLFRLDCTDGATRADARSAVQRFSDRLGLDDLELRVEGDGPNLCGSRTVSVTVAFEHRFPIVSAFARGSGLPSSITLRHTTSSLNENVLASSS